MNMAPRTSGTAVTSLVFGILSWVILPFVGAVIAIITGHMARAEIRRSAPGTLEGDGLALGGLILGWAHIVVVGLAVLCIFLFLGGLAFFAHMAQ
jgi:hypothetical protein